MAGYSVVISRKVSIILLQKLFFSLLVDCLATTERFQYTRACAASTLNVFKMLIAKTSTNYMNNIFQRVIMIQEVFQQTINTDRLLAKLYYLTHRQKSPVLVDYKV